MSQKNKLFKFAQNETFPHMFQPKLMYGSPEDFELKGRWKSDFFHNENHLVPDERVIATRDNVYWMDEDWEEHQVPVLFTDPIESRKGEPS